MIISKKTVIKKRRVYYCPSAKLSVFPLCSSIKDIQTQEISYKAIDHVNTK
jgi:hypothetical protein